MCVFFVTDNSPERLTDLRLLAHDHPRTTERVANLCHIYSKNIRYSHNKSLYGPPWHPNVASKALLKALLIAFSVLSGKFWMYKPCSQKSKVKK